MDGSKEARAMRYMTDDLRIKEIKELAPPSHLLREYPCDEKTFVDRVRGTRGDPPHPARRGRPAGGRHRAVLDSRSERSARIRAPAAWLSASGCKSELEIVMRVYFEKPRTTVGWKGLINDPDLDGSFRINHGLRVARELLMGINVIGHASRLRVSRHDHAAVHRGLCVRGARSARARPKARCTASWRRDCRARSGSRTAPTATSRSRPTRSRPRSSRITFLSVTKGGHSAIVSTKGNDDCHIILRGGKKPNFDAASVASACGELRASGLPEHLMIDASHANSQKDHANQIKVCGSIGQQLSAGESRIIGVMIESHLVSGRQELVAGSR